MPSFSKACHTFCDCFTHLKVATGFHLPQYITNNLLEKLQAQQVFFCNKQMSLFELMYEAGVHEKMENLVLSTSVEISIKEFQGLKN